MTTKFQLQLHTDICHFTKEIIRSSLLQYFLMKIIVSQIQSTYMYVFVSVYIECLHYFQNVDKKLCTIKIQMYTELKNFNMMFQRDKRVKIKEKFN